MPRVNTGPSLTQRQAILCIQQLDILPQKSTPCNSEY